ncbi:MAG TPA: SAM-dependent methyltransferase, partial [Gammaproteobacteria bacterium]|nr:SAM-dependent methyltransferase [Gammaproteobacteria bacterium]
MDSTLPEPDEFEQLHSTKLCELIAAEIETAGGVITFRRYMEMALYQPGLGYYMAGARKFGAEGDFITAPEVSPLFSDCLAAQCQQVLEQLETSGCVLEFGAGSGRMAADILARLEQLESLPDQYYILELSP